MKTWNMPAVNSRQRAKPLNAHLETRRKMVKSSTHNNTAAFFHSPLHRHPGMTPFIINRP